MSHNTTTCCVFGCKLHKCDNRNLSFHCFPPKGKGTVLYGTEIIDRRKAWELACEITRPKKYLFVCSKHFENSDFFPIGTHHRKKRLKKFAVPSKDLPQHTKQGAFVSARDIDVQTNELIRAPDSSIEYIVPDKDVKSRKAPIGYLGNKRRQFSPGHFRVPKSAMVSCSVENCNHNGVEEKCSFFRFPLDPAEFNRWCKLLRRMSRPTVNTRVCSCHFKDGERKNGPEILKVKRSLRYIGRPTPLMPDVANIPASGIPQIEPGLDVQPSLQPSTSITIESNANPMWMEVDPLQIKLEPVSYRPTASTQTDYPLERTNVVILEAENYFLKQQVEELQKKSTAQFSYDLLRGNDKLMRFYTGLSNVKAFESLYILIETEKINYHLKWKVDKIDKRNQLLMCLMKLRHNFPTVDLVLRFGISRTTFSNIMISMISLLHEKIYVNSISPTPKHTSNIPSCMNTCKVILECTEIAATVLFTELTNKRKDWKSLICIGPNGAVCFVSGLYPKSTSDEIIVRECGVLEQLAPNDLVLGDEAISGLLPAGVHLNFRPEEQDKYTERKAKAKTYIDMAVARMKKYKLLSSISQPMVAYGDKIVQLVSALTNFNEENDQFSDDE